jgi:hypothetical protein
MARVETTRNLDALDEITSGFDVEGSYGYTADHAPYVNWETVYAGTSPPFAPIREWVHRKWTDLDAGLKSAADPAGTLTKEEHKDAVAWIVVGAIAENGTKAIRYMERSMERTKANQGAIAAQYQGSEDLHAPFKLVRDFLDVAFGASQDIVADEATDTGKLLQSGFVSVEELNTGTGFEREGGGE